MVWTTQATAQNARAVVSRPCRARQARRSRLAALGGGQSMDSGDEALVDTELTAEFAQLSKPAHAAQEQKRSMLEIGWMIRSGQEAAPVPCETCIGSKTVECSFCGGTGAMRVGDMLYCSDTGCTICPACNGQGSVECRSCRGTGFKASWLARKGRVAGSGPA